MENQQLLLEYHQLCDYGCGRIAKFTFKNGKHCCESAMSKCPATRKRLKETAQENIAKWHANGETCRHHQNKRKSKEWIDNHGKCDNPGCTNFNDGTYGSGRFCSEHCAYQFAYHGKRKGKKTKKQLAHLKKIHQKRKKINGWKCKVCEKDFNTRTRLNHHLQRAHGLKQAIKLETGSFKCPYCDSVWPTNQKLGGHLANCKLHPNKALHDEGHKKAAKKTHEEYVNGSIIPSWLGRTHSKKTKELLSKQTASRVKSGNHDYGRIKTAYFPVQCKNQTYLVQGTWELNVANKLNEYGIIWENKTRLSYVRDGVQHLYRPDMTLTEMPNTYIEVKGYFSEDDKLKMKLVLQSNPQATIYFIHAQDYHNFIAGKLALLNCPILKVDQIDSISKK